MRGLTILWFQFGSVLAATTSGKLQDIGWQCLSNKCKRCSLSGTEPSPCVFDGPGFYETRLSCEIETGCGPMKWQCKTTANPGDRCSSCNTTEGARSGCDTKRDFYKTQTECEVGSQRCGAQCPVGQAYSSCSTCEPSCSDPTTLQCSPWTCLPGCTCPAGMFRTKDRTCVKADQCPQLDQKPCFNIVLQAYTENEDRINKTTWPHSQMFFIPRCTEKGGFERLQCFDQEGECLCVDSAIGIPVPGSKRKIDEGIPDCGDDPAPMTDSTEPPVPKPQQTSELNCTKPNEIYAECVPSNCLPSCEHPSPSICSMDCWSGCICDSGFFRHTNGDCVPAGECNATTICHMEALAALESRMKSQPSDDIEVPTCDPGGNFEREQCRVMSGNLYCWCVDPESGIEIDGTRRAGRIDCNAVGKTQGTDKMTCGSNQIWEECGSSCPPSCTKPVPIFCARNCSVGCRCKPGYLVNEVGECVTPLRCPVAKTKCLQNAYNALTENRPTDGNRYPDDMQPCDEDGNFITLQCKADYCACIDKVTGIEIPGTKGPNYDPPDCNAVEKNKAARQFVALSRRDEIQCGDNEEFAECVTQCPKTCENMQPKACTLACLPGCQCKSGFVKYRDRCILPSSCPPAQVQVKTAWQCNVDEEAKEPCKFCGSDGVDCDESKELFRSIEECEAKTPCGDSGPKCKENEEFLECGSACPDTCANKNIKGPRPCTRQCVPGCFCRKAYRRSANGECIDEAKCPADELGMSHFWACDGKTCISCDEGNDKCNRVNANFGSYEQCMSKTECGLSLLRCGPNETFKACGSSCPSTCDAPGPQVCSRECTPGCFCSPGFLRKRDGTCVGPEGCPAKTKCVKQYLNGIKDGVAVGEFLPACDTGGAYKAKQCQPSTGHCWCVDVKAGTEIEGSRRGPGQGQPDCGSTDSKPTIGQTCVENEEYSECGSPCQPTCQMPHIEGCNAVCQKGCFCKPGYFRDDKGKCVHAKKCEASTSCLIEVLEVYYEGLPPPGAFIPSCTPSGNYSSAQCHGSTGECWCVDPETGDKIEGSTTGPGQGPPKCTEEDPARPGLTFRGPDAKRKEDCKENEEFNECGSACEPSCDNPAPYICTLQCVIGCQCKNGFFRKDGSCVPPNQCSPTTDCHRLVLEAAKRGPLVGAYVPTCDRNGSYVPMQCHSSTGYCWCVDTKTGEEIEGTKVRPGQGPPDCFKPTTSAQPTGKESCDPKAEKFTECGTACEPSCMDPTPQVCTAQCIVNVCQCAEGYFRNADGNCVLPSQCPAKTGNKSCDGKFEKFTECGTACEPSCANPTPQVCTYQCIVNVCQCAEGHFRNEDGKCVPPSQCPAVTECHKQFFGVFEADKMPPPGRFVPSCEKDGSFTSNQCHGSTGYCWCVDTVTGEKKPGSDVGPGRGPPVCEANDSKSCDPKSEKFTNCGSACEPSCSNPTPKLCTDQCIVNVCQCNDGYFRNTKGKCVPPSQCPAVTECHRQFFGGFEADKMPPPGRFVPSCDKDGSFTSVQCHGSTGYCWCVDTVSGEKKPGSNVGPGRGPLVCKVNDKRTCSAETERFFECGTACEPSCSHPTPTVCSRLCIPNVCQCAQGYFRSTDGKCVSPSQCNAVTECHKQYFGAYEGESVPPPGRFLPTCNKDGSFAEVQCHGSTGFCWCVDVTTGKKMEGTEIGPGQGRPNCGLRVAAVSRSNCQGAMDAYSDYCRNLVIAYKTAQKFCKWRGFKATCARTCCGL